MPNCSHSTRKTAIAKLQASGNSTKAPHITSLRKAPNSSERLERGSILNLSSKRILSWAKQLGDDSPSIGDVLRIFAFIIGILSLISGFADFGAIGNGDVISAFSTGPLALIKILVGVIFVILAINPNAIGVLIHWIIRSE